MAYAALRSFSRRSLSPKWFSKPSTSPTLVLHQAKDYTKPTLSDSSLVARSFHRQVFFEDRKKVSFAQPVCSGVLIHRHISSSSIKLDALGDIVVRFVPEKSFEAMSTTIDGGSAAAAIEYLYRPVYCVINAIHDLTGFNWSISVVLTALLVSGLMFPVSMLIQRQLWELKILHRSILKVRRVMQTCDPTALPKQKKWEAECIHKFRECYKSYLPLSLLNIFITIIFINGINTMAKNIPGFTDLSTLDSFYMLPLMTGLTFWYTSKVPTISLTKIMSKMNELPLYCIFFIVVQAAYKYEPAVYFYVIPYKISLCTLSWVCRYKQIAKLSKKLGVPVPVTACEQQRILARVISAVREFIDVLKKKDKK